MCHNEPKVVRILLFITVFIRAKEFTGLVDFFIDLVFNYQAFVFSNIAVRRAGLGWLWEDDLE